MRIATLAAALLSVTAQLHTVEHGGPGPTAPSRWAAAEQPAVAGARLDDCDPAALRRVEPPRYFVGGSAPFELGYDAGYRHGVVDGIAGRPRDPARHLSAITRDPTTQHRNRADDYFRHSYADGFLAGYAEGQRGASRQSS
jgi:hypothetical protein